MNDGHFVLKPGRLEELFDQRAAPVLRAASDPTESDEVLIDLELFLVAHFDDPRFHQARDSELLAWLAYLLGTHDGLIEGPPGFGAKAILGHASGGPIADDYLLLQVKMDGATPVVSDSLFAGQLLGDRPRSTDAARAQIVRVAEAMLEHASQLIPAARRAAET